MTNVASGPACVAILMRLTVLSVVGASNSSSMTVLLESCSASITRQPPEYSRCLQIFIYSSCQYGLPRNAGFGQEPEGYWNTRGENGFGYFFLLDKAEYLNHFYLILLFLILICFLFPREAVAERAVVSAVFAIRAQTEIMLLFARIMKVTPDWLAAEPLGLRQRDQADLHPLCFLFHDDWVTLAGA
ncbi:hypothetical protein D3P04_19805 [Paracoccus onubensis]|uniref:HTTM domain-containing protein n=1 Tax=Paracoccus onubensis TaxID=1675788 RepID=A0A418SNI0_9RHOB|nr:hypothetical protein D3P04_19805 [Paracoccus onubensis]